MIHVRLAQRLRGRAWLARLRPVDELAFARQDIGRDVVAMEMGPHVAPANKNVAPGAKQLLIINISNYTVL